MLVLRLLLTTLLSTFPPLFAQAERIVSLTDGNFELRGSVRPSLSLAVILHFRAKSGLGYRLSLTSSPMGRLDDPGRRPGVLAISELSATRETAFRIIANGPRIQLELNGKTAWDYTEKEAGVASSGAVSISGPVRKLEFRPLPPTLPSFAERYGTAIGGQAPPIAALDQSGQSRDFASLRGPKGLWILFIRSADW